MTCKNEIIDAIMRLNPSATAEFLAEFSLGELSDYLRQLETVVGTPPTASAAVPTDRTPQPA